MKILTIVNLYPVPFKPYYDSQFADLLEAGHELTIFSAGATDADTVNEKVRRFGLDRRVTNFPVTRRHLPGSLPGLGRALGRDPAGAVRAMASTFAGARPRLTNAARAGLVGGLEPDMVLIHGTRTATWFSWLREVLPETPVAFYYHGGEVPSVKALGDERARSAFEVADAVFTNTTFSRDHAVDRGCPPDRIHILPVGFDFRDFEPAPDRSYRRDGILRLLSAGRMSEEKGFIYALQALRHLVHEKGLDRIHYSLTGAGYYRPRLQAYVEEHGLEDHVTFLGTLTTQELIQAQRETDVLLLPSIQVGNWVENQACAVQETMLMKGVAIVSRTGGVPESVAPEMRPLIHEEKDWEALASSIEEVYHMSPDELARLGAAGRRFVVEGYDVGELNRRLIETTFRAAGKAVPTG